MKSLVVFALSIFLAVAVKGQSPSKYNIKCLNIDSKSRYLAHPKFTISGDTLFFDVEQINYCNIPEGRFECRKSGRRLTMIQHFPDKFIRCASIYQVTGWVKIKGRIQDLNLLEWRDEYYNTTGKVMEANGSFFEIITETRFRKIE